MDRKKVFFIVLVIFAVLYFVSLGTGVVVNKGGDGGQPANPSAATDRWVSALGSLFSAFAPALDLSNLSCDRKEDGEVVESKPVEGEFKLEVKGVGEQSCEIAIPPDPGEDYRKAELKANAYPAGVYVRAKFDEDRFEKKDRDDNCFLDSEKLPHGLRLEVRYLPNASSNGPTWECWLGKKLGKAVAITAFEEGGKLRLTLRCDDCKKGPGCDTPCPSKENTTQSVSLRME